MDQISPVRRASALAALALGGFAIGLAEFVVMGLLPEMAADLLPDEYARSSEAAMGHAGWLITVYALGVVVGAPAIAALTARLPRKPLVIGLLALFVVGTVASATAPTFELVLLGRFVAALPHGAYFGAAGLVASRLIGGNSHGRGFALVIGGLTIANVAGVPVITSLGQAAGWRVAYLAVAGIFALALIATLAVVPPVSSTVGASPRAELRALRSPQVWLTALVAAIGFAGFLAVYTYAAPITTQAAGLPSSAVPWVLAVAGIGMTIGNLLGGVAADRDLRRSLVLGFSAIVVAGLFFYGVARTPVGLFVAIFLIGATSMFVSAPLQARLIQAAPGAQLMGAAINQSAMNIANSFGAWIGGVIIAGGLGYLTPALAGSGLAVIGVALCVLSFRESSVATPSEVREPVLAA